MLRAGGSAVDAAIAVQMVLDLVEPQSSRHRRRRASCCTSTRASGALAAYDGRETAPAAATGRPVPRRRRRSPLRLLRPRSTAACRSARPALLRMLERPTRATAGCPGRRCSSRRSGSPSRAFRSRRDCTADRRVRAADRARARRGRATSCEPDGCRPRAAGTLLRNPALAADASRSIAADGAQAFYRRTAGAAIVDGGRGASPAARVACPSPISQAYRAREREPRLRPRTAAYRICGMPPPARAASPCCRRWACSSTSTCARCSPRQRRRRSTWSPRPHRLAYADRARHVADDGFVPVPVDGAARSAATWRSAPR